MRIELTLAESEPLIREVTEGGGEFRLFPKGTSMLPLLRQGKDSVALIKAEEGLRVGDIPLYKRENGDFVLHRIVKIEKDGNLTMCGDNQTALERGIRAEQVIAKTAAIYRGEKRVDTKKLSYRTYCFLWRCFFIRKVYFALRKLKNRKKLG